MRILPQEAMIPSRPGGNCNTRTGRPLVSGSTAPTIKSLIQTELATRSQEDVEKLLLANQRKTRKKTRRSS